MVLGRTPTRLFQQIQKTSRTYMGYILLGMGSIKLPYVRKLLCLNFLLAILHSLVPLCLIPYPTLDLNRMAQTS